jgi:phenylacetate-CoA ligase
MQDGQGRMKPCYDNAFLEVVEPDARNVGDLVVTTLTNDYMPLLRYRIGDLVERREGPYETNYVVHGRARDALRADDGSRVTTWNVDQCFEGVEGIAHYQLHQEKDGTCRLRFVPDTNTDAPEAKELKTVTGKLENLLQPKGAIEVEAVKNLPPTTSGKFRLTVRE